MTDSPRPVTAGLDDLNSADATLLAPILVELSGSKAWARAMIEARPFPTTAALHATAREILEEGDDDEVIAAVAAHPPIGARGQLSAASAREQSVAAGADAAISDRLAEAQERYAQHFGHGFLVCATGLSSAEVLAEVDRRMSLTPEQDFADTREHLARINALRLNHLLETGSL